MFKLLSHRILHEGMSSMVEIVAAIIKEWPTARIDSRWPRTGADVQHCIIRLEGEYYITLNQGNVGVNKPGYGRNLAEEPPITADPSVVIAYIQNYIQRTSQADET